jgi:hypothetical protein
MNADKVLKFYNKGLRNESFEFDEQKGGALNIWRQWYYLIGVVSFVLAIYLSWNCYSKLAQNTRILYTVLAAIFGPAYLIFYLVYHILMKMPCQ